MIFHLSIPADHPEHVAGVIAELWRGVALPFPPYAGGYIAFAGDDRNSAIEVYPRGIELFPADGDEDAEARPTTGAHRSSSTHVAIATPLSEDEVHALARREGWQSKYRSRGGQFGVIEFWVENCLMIEVLTDRMQAEYLSTMAIDSWRAMLAQGRPGG